MNRDLIIDCFAGGGGASVGIEMALGRPVDIAINHDPDAILPAADVWKAIGRKPLFGHHSGKNSKTFWGCYMKGVD